MLDCRKGWVAAVIGCAAMAGCGGVSGDDALVAAKGHLRERNAAGALIELKNSLAAKPDSAEARFLLGTVLLGRDEYQAASAELTKARTLGYPDDAVVPVLAESLLRSGEPRKAILLNESVLTAPSAQAQLKTITSSAFAALGDLARADTALNAALAANPQHAPALLARARMLAAKGDVTTAENMVDRILAASPGDPDALSLKGELLDGMNGKPQEAVAAYRAAQANRPDHLEAAAGLLTHFLRVGDMTSAQAEWLTLKKMRPGHAQTLYFEARIASQKGDIKQARELSERLVASLPENSRILQLAGIVALQAGQPLQAEKHLSRLVQLSPEFLPGHYLLARAHLTAGKPEKAIAVLSPWLASGSAPASWYALVGSAQLLAGDSASAEAALSKAAQLDHPTSKAALALADYSRGRVQTGLNKLEEISTADAGTVADMALISAKFNQRDYDGALLAIDRLERKRPRDLQSMQLRGQILMRQGNLAAARNAFESALSIDANFFAAADSLGALDLRENRPRDARARFERLVAANPKNAQAWTALAAIDEQAGKSKDDVIASLSKAVASSPSDASIRRRLIAFHLGKQNVSAALAAAQEADAAIPNNWEIVEALARAQDRAGQANQALMSYNKLVGLLPKSAEAQLSLASVYASAKKDVLADQAVRSALSIAPGVPSVVQQAAGLYVLSGRFDEAAKLALDLRRFRGQQAAGDELLGDVEASRQAWQPAIKAYQAALRQSPQTQLAQKLHGALRASSKPAAQTFAANWMNDHPADIPFFFYVGGTALSAKDYRLAERCYQSILKLHPDHALALNNLAWATWQLRKPGALDMAERANHQLPDVPVIMDTLALLLAESQHYPEAVALQRRAMTLAPESPALRLTLAKIHLRTNDKGAARAELQQLRSLGERYADHEEVKTLLSQLN